MLVPRLAAFAERHPGITVDLVLAERYVDLVDERFELAIRLIDPGASASLVAKRIGTFRMVVCCAPGSLRGRRAPAHPEDLADHACLVHSAAAVRDEWPFRGPDGAHVVRVAGPLRTNDVDAIQVAAVAGLGVALLPSFVVRRELEAGTLVPLLEAFTLSSLKAWAVHAERRHRSARLRAFLARPATALS